MFARAVRTPVIIATHTGDSEPTFCPLRVFRMGPQARDPCFGYFNIQLRSCTQGREHIP